MKFSKLSKILTVVLLVSVLAISLIACSTSKDNKDEKQSTDSSISTLMATEPSDADEASKLYNQFVKKENEILSTDKALWEKVFMASNKETPMIEDGTNYGDFLLKTIESAKDQFTDEEYKKLIAGAEQVKEIEGKLTILEQKYPECAKAPGNGDSVPADSNGVVSNSSDATSFPSFDGNSFRQLRLNQWVKQAVRWMPMEKWDACAFPVDPEELEGRVCYGGLDLSSITDLTCFCLVFPPEDESEPYYILPYYWLPEETLPLRVNRDHVPYDVWERQGYIQTTEGNVVHYGFIEKFIEALGEKYNIREIAFDRWGAIQMVQNLEGMGFTVVPMGQGFASMSPPTKELMKLSMIVYGYTWLAIFHC